MKCTLGLILLASSWSIAPPGLGADYPSIDGEQLSEFVEDVKIAK